MSEIKKENSHNILESNAHPCRSVVFPTGTGHVSRN